jgi:hypothetical protein
MSEEYSHLDSDSGQILLEDIHLGEEDVVLHDVTEMDNYLITEDPLDPTNQEAWAVVILSGTYKDWVVRFPEVLLDKGELVFTYEVIHLPEEGEFEELDFVNFISSVLTEAIADLHGSEGQVYVDVETGEQIVNE